MTKRLPPIIPLLATLAICGTTTSTKVWIDLPGFDNPSNWESGYLPCPQDEIVFPESYSAAIVLAAQIDTIGITLPRDGALLLQPDSQIIFSSGISNGRKCKNSNQVAKMNPIPTRPWFDPHSWLEVSDDVAKAPNAAVPHIERIPCNNESVRISAVGPLAIDMNNVRTLRVGQINLDGADVSTEFMENLFETELGEVMLKDASLTKVEYYKEPVCGCHQPDLFWEYEWSVCKHVQDLCGRPKCLTPIIPSGHCCSVCGVMLKVFVDKCDPSYPGKLEEMIRHSLKEEQMEDQLRYHVSFVDAGVVTYLQVIILEQGDYEENSVKFMHRFNETVAWDVFQHNEKKFFTSGRPYNPNGFGAALLLMLGTLVGVLVFFAVIFAHFVPDNGVITLPRWMHIRWYDLFPSPFVFARFDNTQAAEGEATENVVIDVQQYNVSAEYPERTEGTSTSFDNPMFVENPSSKAARQEDNDNAYDDDDDDDVDDIPLREGDLTEIDLETEIERKL